MAGTVIKRKCWPAGRKQYRVVTSGGATAGFFNNLKAARLFAATLP